jgi:hypothetical protein
MTAHEADAMVEQQDGLCAICRSAPAAHVDHDHATDVVRQLLCFNCNGGLGRFTDDTTVLRAAAAYVERHRADDVEPVEGRPERPVRVSRRRPSRAEFGVCRHGLSRLREFEQEA